MHTETLRVAILEDDESQRDLIERLLECAGYTCAVFAQGKALLSALARESYDLYILDWEVPDVSGEQALAWIRSHIEEPVPVLFVTARNSEEDIVHALAQGADDYMVKPIRERELLARVAALARRLRRPQVQSDKLEIEGFSLDLKPRTISRSGKQLNVTSKDFDVALFLLRNLGRLLSRGHIYEAVWGRAANINTRTVDTHVSRVRVKLGLTPENGWQITPIYQYGYRLERLEKVTAGKS